jgi:hypothetical protein
LSPRRKLGPRVRTRGVRLIVFGGLVAGIAFLLATTAGAQTEDSPVKERDVEAHETPLEQAREEAGVEEDRPRTRFDVSGGELRLSASELVAASLERLALSMTLSRDVRSATLTITLPERWIERSRISGLRFAHVPETGRGTPGRAAASRQDRSVKLSFSNASAGDSASFAIRDVGLPAGTYELPYSWREDGTAKEKGIAKVIFYAPVREGDKPVSALTRLADPGLEFNVTNDASTESETFVSIVPGDKNRFLVGANGGGFNAWVTNDGGQSFTKASMPSTLDAPGEPAPEAADLCCDPMSVADTAGNIWYGGLSRANGAGNPSRIVVNRIAPGLTTFQPQTVGLRQRTAGTQDKPMMTIDNTPGSATFGRLYVIWDEPAAGINIVISQCDTRPGGVLNEANCDSADNWTAPVSVTPSTGSYIYADVAVGPDGKVYAVWWDYSAANAIRGDVCAPATQNCATALGWGTPQTIARLDATGGVPVPFACPILAQPGGRASTSPQVDVDHSIGPQNGRVYVTWSDLRTGSGATRCADSTAPVSTHLTWDSFVTSAASALPGSANPSPNVATRLLTDGEGGGQANSDDWFAWLAVDQTTGQAWADFYSTREDATRDKTNFYVRTVTPAVSGHTLGALNKVSSLPSDYSNNPCCGFGNDYGDYTGIDATEGVAIPVWSDKRDPGDGEAYAFVEADPTTRTLTVAKAGSGSGTVTGPGISCGTDCRQAYADSTSVTLAATPAANSTFAGWSGACTGVGSCVVTMSAARFVIATFGLLTPPTRFLTVAKAGSGSGTVTGPGISCGSDCSEGYADGTTVALTATRAANSTFAGWSGACSGTGSCVVTMSADTLVTATFRLRPALRVSNVVVTEGNSGSKLAVFKVRLSRASGKRITVRYATANGTARAPSDYAAKSRTLTFLPGQVLKKVSVIVKGDRRNEANETFFLRLSRAVNATIADARGKGTIVDND